MSQRFWATGARVGVVAPVALAGGEGHAASLKPERGPASVLFIFAPAHGSGVPQLSDCRLDAVERLATGVELTVYPASPSGLSDPGLFQDRGKFPVDAGGAGFNAFDGGINFHDCGVCALLQLMASGNAAGRICIDMPRRGMDDLREAARSFFRSALDKTGWTPYRLAKEAKVASTSITRLLNDPTYKFVPKLDTLLKVATASGVDLPTDLRQSEPVDMVELKRSIPVMGEVSAGVWKQVPDSSEAEDWLPMDVPEYAGASLFALLVRGRSMDEIYADGTYVILAPPAEAGLRIGDRVVVRQYDAGGRAETTLKEITKGTAGSLVLSPRSSDLSLTPIIIPMDRDSDIGVEIVGVVVSSYTKERRGTGPLLSI